MKSIKFLLNQKWAKDFFSKKINQYFPKKQLINCEIEPLKIYLDYKSVVIKYRLELLDEEKNISEKNIIGKAEKLRKNSNILVNYSTTKFLREQGLKDIVPNPLEYLPLFNLYLYEFVPGYFLQKLSVEHKDREFLAQIPAAVKILKRIHEVKPQKKDKIVKRNKKWEEEQGRRDLKLIQQYWPAVFDKTLLWLQECRFLRERYKKYFDFRLYRMIHGDFYSRNILVSGRDNSQIKLIDFSSSAVYEPLNDISNFLINTELMFEYDFPNTYRRLMKESKTLFFQNYFSKPITKEQEFKIDYFILRNLIRIIASAAISEGGKKLPEQANVVMDKLIRLGEEKYLILKNHVFKRKYKKH